MNAKQLNDLPEVREARRACNALFLELAPQMARDVSWLVEAAFAAIVVACETPPTKE